MVACVARDRARNFEAPKLSARFWIPSAFSARVPMPKTTIDEDGQLVPEILAAIDGETAHLGLRQVLEETSEVAFIPAIGGG